MYLALQRSRRPLHHEVLASGNKWSKATALPERFDTLKYAEGATRINRKQAEA